MKTQVMKLTDLKMDGGTQARATLRPEMIDEYADDMAKQLKVGPLTFPPLKAFHDGENYWLSRGFHRYYAAEKAGIKEFDVQVVSGTLRDAILDAAGDNADHGIRRTQADKRKAIKILLQDSEWCEKSNRWVAEAAKVSDHLVKEVREEIEAKAQADGKKTEEAKRTGRDGKARLAKARKVCDRCKRLGKPVRGCPQCNELRKAATTKPSKVKFDFRGFERDFGRVSRGVDAIAKAYEDLGSEQKGCNRILSEFYKAYESWKKKLLKK